MSPLQLFVTLSALALTVVIGQNQLDFADPPPLPVKGTFLFVNMHEHSYTCILWNDPPLLQMHITSFHNCQTHIPYINSSKFGDYKDTVLLMVTERYKVVGQVRFF